MVKFPKLIGSIIYNGAEVKSLSIHEVIQDSIHQKNQTFSLKATINNHQSIYNFIYSNYIKKVLKISKLF